MASDTTMNGDEGLINAEDGRALKASIARSLRRRKISALLLIAPLLLFVLVSFIAPIADMLFRSVENQIVSDVLPQTTSELNQQGDNYGSTPDEDVYEALMLDMVLAAEEKKHTQLGTRLNYEQTGISSLFRKSGRKVDDIAGPYFDAITDQNKEWKKGQIWANLLGDPNWVEAQKKWDDTPKESRSKLPPDFVANEAAKSALPTTTAFYTQFAAIATNNEDAAIGEKPLETLAYVLMKDVSKNRDAADVFDGEIKQNLEAATSALNAVKSTNIVNVKDGFAAIDNAWVEPETWDTIKLYAPRYTNGYFLNAFDMKKGVDGVELRPENERIYIKLFVRTLVMSTVITFLCILLGYPIGYILSTLPMRTSNVLLILVLLPFWTSLLVRTSAWKVLLQQQGVINDFLVFIGIVADDGRLELINNMTGTFIAMTHILLPFMILPLYSVMKTIPPYYVRAAKSLGANDWTAFWKVYFPQSLAGIGAGSVLVFILAIGYYITPELVGGTKGVFISNRIAYHISSSLNWGLGAALGTMLLALVLVFYWLYDKFVGIDNVKLG